MSQGSDNNNNKNSESEADSESEANQDFISEELAEQVTATNRVLAQTTESVLSIDFERLSITSSLNGVSSKSSEDEFIQFQSSRDLFSLNEGQSAYDSDPEKNP